jgi:glycosyltransferase involved in cell wall biosynthesis
MSSQIAIISLFRDRVDDVRQVGPERSKWTYDQKKITHICIEGDSVDGTYDELIRWKKGADNIIVQKADTGCPKYGSVAEPARLINLARLWNIGIELAIERRPDYVMLLDSDIRVGPTVLKQLRDREVDVVAPMLLFERSVYFRDTWAYRAVGEQFSNRPPYSKAYKRAVIFEAESVGVPLMRLEILKAGARCLGDEVVGLCRSVRELGYTIWVDPLAYVYHPRMGLEIPPMFEHK